MRCRAYSKLNHLSSQLFQVKGSALNLLGPGLNPGEPEAGPEGRFPGMLNGRVFPPVKWP